MKHEYIVQYIEKRNYIGPNRTRTTNAAATVINLVFNEGVHRLTCSSDIGIPYSYYGSFLLRAKASIVTHSTQVRNTCSSSSGTFPFPFLDFIFFWRKKQAETEAKE